MTKGTPYVIIYLMNKKRGVKMVELIRYTVVGGIIGLVVYEIFSSKREICRLTREVENERNRLNVVAKESYYLMGKKNSIESQIRTLERNVYDKDWMELNWEKTQVEKEYKKKMEQIDRVNKIQKGE